MVTAMDKRINNVLKAMKRAKDYDMKVIWSRKLHALFEIKGREHEERIQDGARSVH
tara:strand:- start:249 stop:416 length:168 start_codon:yes stop_codon:yes gene_type:complete